MSEQPTIHELLKSYWGYTSFREKQEEIIQSVLDGNDTLGILATGGGKSICFQVPTLKLEGICLVISPLIALMQDQVDNLNQRGIKALAIHSGMSKREVDIGLDNAAYGNYKFLYVSPERLETEIFKARLPKMNVNLLVVDEAHCISQWGYDFRPSYLKIAEIRSELTGVPVLALTASATPKVVGDIQEKLHFKQPNCIQKSFHRDNLAYVVIKTEDQDRQLFKVIEGVQGSGIIYVGSRRKTKEISQLLIQNGLSADFYHAGLSVAERAEKQKRWLENNSRIMVCTNAFGMGIDKADVRFVIHLELPSSMEAYYQEAGRAGRDGKKAYAVIINGPNSIAVLKDGLSRDFPSIDIIKKVYLGLANYFQIPTDGGSLQQFPFDIGDFSRQYKLSIIEVYRSLYFLEKEGYLQLSEGFNNRSKLNIIVTKEDLYKFQVAHKQHDTFLKTLLRTYGGLFDHYIPINEGVIAKNLKTNRSRIKEVLERLAELKLVDYVAQSNLPTISYNQPRVRQEELYLSKANYQERKKIANEQINAIIKYVQNEHACRANLLVAYFGEKRKEDCGICDICLNRRKKGTTKTMLKEIEELILQYLEENESDIQTLVDRFNQFPTHQVTDIIEFLIDEEIISTDGIRLALKD